MGENVLKVLIEFMQVDMVIVILNYCCVQSLKPCGEGILKIRGSRKGDSLSYSLGTHRFCPSS
jgi:hypothetical protein